MKYSEYRELLSPINMFSKDTIMIDAKILDPCYYNKKFEIDFDEIVEDSQIIGLINYLKKVGCREVILRWDQ